MPIYRSNPIPKAVGIDVKRQARSFDENQFTKGLYFGKTIYQNGSIHDFSRNNADLIFTGGVTQAETYSAEANTLSIAGGVAAKGWQMPPDKFQWNLQNRESLFIQLRVKVINVTDLGHILGNSLQATQPGFLFVCQTGGGMVFNVKFGVAAGVGYNAGTQWVNNTFVNVTLWVDGGSRIFNGWVNGLQPTAWKNVPLVPDVNGSYLSQNLATPFALMFGESGSVTYPATGGSNTRASRYEAIRIMTLPPDLMLRNASQLDWSFNVRPISFITEADLSLTKF